MAGEVLQKEFDKAVDFLKKEEGRNYTEIDKKQEDEDNKDKKMGENSGNTDEVKEEKNEKDADKAKKAAPCDKVEGKKEKKEEEEKEEMKESAITDVVDVLSKNAEVKKGMDVSPVLGQLVKALEAMAKNDEKRDTDTNLIRDAFVSLTKNYEKLAEQHEGLVKSFNEFRSSPVREKPKSAMNKSQVAERFEDGKGTKLNKAQISNLLYNGLVKGELNEADCVTFDVTGIPNQNVKEYLTHLNSNRS